MDGIHVVMRTATELVIALGGDRFIGRFLFLPASLRANDRVWLRIERQIDAFDGSPVDVTARLLRVIPDARGIVPWRPHTGMRFLMTIDTFGAAAGVGDGPTRARFDGKAAMAAGDAKSVEQTIAVNVRGLRSAERSEAFAAVDGRANGERWLPDDDDVDPTERAASGSDWEQTLRDADSTSVDYSAVPS